MSATAGRLELVPKTSARLLALLSLLQARRDWPGVLLAERLAVSPRTVRRDVDRLRELGYPIAAFKGPDGGYRLEAGTRLPPLLFDDEQAVALAVALRTAGGSGAGIAEDAARALATVRQVMPARLRNRVDRLTISTVERPTTQRDSPVSGKVLEAIGAAVHACEVLRFDYASPPGTADRAPGPPRRVEPHHLVVRAARWYLVAWDLERADWRVFRADRITPRTPAGPRFVPRELPGGDLNNFLTGRFRGAEAGAGWPCRGEVILHLPIAEITPYLRDEVAEELAPDRTRLLLGSWSWISLATMIGRFDAEFDVLAPPELTSACARLARRYTAAATPATRIET